jgi:hypothetical protein
VVHVIEDNADILVFGLSVIADDTRLIAESTLLLRRGLVFGVYVGFDNALDALNSSSGQLVESTKADNDILVAVKTAS